jgi:hypothetical protein
VRISKIEIIGRKRMNRNSSAKKNPIGADEHRPLPTAMADTCPHDDGQKFPMQG